MKKQKDKIIVIVGPTAVGKTALSVELAKKLNGEIISADSMQVYESLSIGTAKVTADEMEGIPHYLIDCVPISGSYSVHDFKEQARKKISDITSRGKLPIVVGGTGLYIQALLFDFQLGQKKTEQETQLQKKWETYLECYGKQRLWEALAQVDERAAQAIHPNNTRRVQRALVVKEHTGMSLLEQDTVDFTDLSEAIYDVQLIGLSTDRPLLYERINQRVDLMMSSGLLDEVRLLANHRDYQSAQGIGYKEFFPYLDGEISLEEAVSAVKQNSRRYAKRQLTWFRNRMTVDWWDIVKEPEQVSCLEQQLERWWKGGNQHE